ncbi:hypothetical protein ACYFX5_03865 [Bremerella sp. T1]|uniref:hypothetical protein n=1 Tax=Bremerella sp. TYQ1 TaxID=3119568 RepID=UPI001CCECC7E|nr:hypothetical protein [Bremerella volcania]UBM37407.1 hypothetical protein LA756_05820 [Bremerella volcania]
MGLLDIFFGGKPTSWTDDQYEKFKTAYYALESGSVGLLDYLPPTNVAALGGKIAGGSVKVLIDRGEMGKYASWTESLHKELQQGTRLQAIKAIWCIQLEGKVKELDTTQVFITICALHVAVYDSLTAN